MDAVNNNTSTAGAQATHAVDKEQFDFEAAMMSVNMARVDNIDDQLKTMIDGIQANNAKAARLNDAYRLVNSFVEKFGTETDPNKTKGDLSPEDMKALNSAMSDLGMDPSVLFGKRFSENDAYNNDPNRHEIHVLGMTLNGAKPTGFANVTLSDFKAAAATLKGEIDKASNTNQMDMLRLQNWTGKRNEAFETMSTLLKKLMDALNAILAKI